MILCVCKIFTIHNELNEDDEKIYTRSLIIQIEFRIQRVGNHHSTNEKYFQLALQSLSNVAAVKIRFVQTAKKYFIILVWAVENLHVLTKQPKSDSRTENKLICVSVGQSRRGIFGELFHN